MIKRDKKLVISVEGGVIEILREGKVIAIHNLDGRVEDFVDLFIVLGDYYRSFYPADYLKP